MLLGVMARLNNQAFKETELVFFTALVHASETHNARSNAQPKREEILLQWHMTPRNQIYSIRKETSIHARSLLTNMVVVSHPHMQN